MQAQNIFKFIFDRQSQVYTSHYCEENIYLLCQAFQNLIKEEKIDAKTNQGFAIIISNSFKTTQIRHQKQGDKLNHQMVNWDYHAIFLHRQQVVDNGVKINVSHVYDFDTTLDWPTQFDTYFEKSHQFQKQIPSQFRFIEANKFLEYFASDRSHMKDKDEKTGRSKWVMPPPSYECIKNINSETNTLQQYLDIDEKGKQYGFPYMNETDFFNLFKIKQTNVQK